MRATELELLVRMKNVGGSAPGLGMERRLNG